MAVRREYHRFIGSILLANSPTEGILCNPANGKTSSPRIGKEDEVVEGNHNNSLCRFVLSRPARLSTA